MDAFADRLDRIIELSKRAEQLDKKRLSELVKSLVLSRIEESVKDKQKQTASELRNLIYKGKPPKILLETREQYKEELTKKYQEKRQYIELMQAEQLFELLAKLKDGNKLLATILISIPKIPFSTRYKLVLFP